MTNYDGKIYNKIISYFLTYIKSNINLINDLIKIYI